MVIHAIELTVNVLHFNAKRVPFPNLDAPVDQHSSVFVLQHLYVHKNGHECMKQNGVCNSQVARTSAGLYEWHEASENEE